MLGALAGGLITFATVRIDRNWDRAKIDIARLCDQVSAYHQLEKLYKSELARAEGKGRSEKTVMEEMRARVADGGEHIRPTMTSHAAHELRRQWH